MEEVKVSALIVLNDMLRLRVLASLLISSLKRSTSQSVTSQGATVRGKGVWDRNKSIGPLDKHSDHSSEGDNTAPKSKLIRRIDSKAGLAMRRSSSNDDAPSESRSHDERRSSVSPRRLSNEGGCSSRHERRSSVSPRRLSNEGGSKASNKKERRNSRSPSSRDLRSSRSPSSRDFAWLEVSVLPGFGLKERFQWEGATIRGTASTTLAKRGAIRFLPLEDRQDMMAKKVIIIIIDRVTKIADTIRDTRGKDRHRAHETRMARIMYAFTKTSTDSSNRLIAI